METEVEVEEITVEDLDIPCSGLSMTLPDGTPTIEYPCDNPATWRGTVRCCGTRSFFSCDAHKVLQGLSGTQCARCNARPIEVFWNRL